VRDGNAANVLGLGRGAVVRIRDQGSRKEA
jgi:hypothetical protein